MRCRTRRGLAFLLLCCAVGGCHRSESGRAPETRKHADDADVVATVGEVVIRSDDVRDRMSLEGLGPKAAVESLIDEALLSQAARRADFVPDPKTLRAADRLMVRAYLGDLEATHEPSDIPRAAVTADFEEHRESYEVLERRASTHLLVKSDSNEARRFAARALAEARAADDPVAALKAVEGPSDAGDELAFIVETLPAITRKAGMEKPFIDALFKTKTKGPLKNVVKTPYGWHAIVVTDIEPGERRTMADVEAEIRDRLSQKARFEELVAVVQRLESEGLVRYEREAVDRLLAAEGGPVRAQ